jgi:hypothetical protein
MTTRGSLGWSIVITVIGAFALAGAVAAQAGDMKDAAKEGGKAAVEDWRNTGAADAGVKEGMAPAEVGGPADDAAAGEPDEQVDDDQQ